MVGDRKGKRFGRKGWGQIWGKGGPKKPAIINFQCIVYTVYTVYTLYPLYPL